MLRQPVFGESLRACRKPPSAGKGTYSIFSGFSASGERVAVELRVMARTRHRADVSEAFDAIGMEQSDEALDRQGRMPEGEDGVLRPLLLPAGRDACSCSPACAIGLPRQQHRAVHELEQAKRRDPACARHEEQDSHEFGVPGGADAGDARRR